MSSNEFHFIKQRISFYQATKSTLCTGQIATELNPDLKMHFMPINNLHQTLDLMLFNHQKKNSPMFKEKNQNTNKK